MAQSKPVALCSHLMPSGKLCRGVALRNERFCRSHIRNYRLIEADRAQNAALERLSLQVQRMDLPALLFEIKTRLVNLSRSYTIARFPEICYLLTVADDWLTEAKSSESDTDLEAELDQIPEDLSKLTPNEMNEMFEKFLKSIN